MSALLQRNQERVEVILFDNPKSLLETGSGGETPFHVSVSWPRGVELLIQHGTKSLRSIIDQTDVNSKTPLQYAVFLRKLETIKILLDSGATIDFDNVAMFDRRPGPIIDYSVDLEIQLLLAKGLADRSKELLEFALEHLTERSVREFRLRDKVLLEDNVSEIMHALEEQCITIPQRLRILPFGSVYHSENLDRDAAEAFFQAGFKSVDVRVDGLSPLMTLNSTLALPEPKLLALIGWFLTKGANIHAPISPPSPCDVAVESTSHKQENPHLVVHRLADLFGRFDGYTSPKTGAQYGEHIQAVLGDPATDHCTCYCSHHGCTPMSIFTRRIVEILRNTKWEPEHGLELYKNGHARNFLDADLVLGCDARLRCFLYFAETVLSASHDNTTAETILRTASFDYLGMKHTCCSWSNGCQSDGPMGLVDFHHRKLAGEISIVQTMDEEEVLEIQDEDGHLADELDVLVQKLCSDYVGSSTTFTEFFLGTWCETMVRLKNKRDPQNSEERDALRALGITLETTE